MTTRTDAAPQQLARYPMVAGVGTRYSDVDRQGHVNNVAIAGIYEEARVRLLDRVAGPDRAEHRPAFWFVLAEQQIRYLTQLHYPGEVEIGMGVSRIGRSSFVVFSGLFRDGRCVGQAKQTMVHMGADGPMPAGPELRAALEDLVFADPEQFDLR